MQRTKSKILSILLSLVMLLSLLPTTALATDSHPAAEAVLVDGKYFGKPGKLYYKNNDTAETFTGTATDYNAAYDETTGVLTLQDYKGGSIIAGGATTANITIKLVGDNFVTGSVSSDMGGDITITSDSSGTLSITNTLSGSNAAIGIETGLSASYTTGNVTIKGNAKVTINMTHNGTSTYEKAYGIFAKKNITISENASVDITCATPNNTTGGGNCNGLYAAKDVTIDTNGTIKIDVTNAGRDKDNGYSYGVYHMRTATLTKVGNMEVQWKREGNSTSYSGGAFTRGATFSGTDHAVNVDTTNCYASYRKGTPYTVTVVNGDLAGPGVVPYAKNDGEFLAGDTVSIKPGGKTSNDNTPIPFKEWIAEGVKLKSLATTADNSFTVPGKDVTVTATHSPFVGTPVFKSTSSSSGTIEFKTVANPDNSEFFQYVKNGETTYNGIYPQPTTTSTKSPYAYSVSVSTYYVGDIKNLEAGDYRMAVTLNGERYLSEPFTVAYTESTANISLSETGTVDFGEVKAGYTTAPAAKTVTITNSGAAATGELTIALEGTNATSFELNKTSISDITAGTFDTFTVQPKTGLSANTYTDTVKVSGTGVTAQSFDVKFTVKDPNASASVSGKVTSYGSDSDDVTVQLIEAGHTEPAYEAIVTGNSATYSFPTVPAGTYTLKVMKKGHAPWTESITVGDGNVTKDVTIYLYGDINGDGFVKANDKAFLARYLAYWPGYETLPVYPAVADLNGDGFIKANDKAILARYLAYWPGYETLPIT